MSLRKSLNIRGALNSEQFKKNKRKLICYINAKDKTLKVDAFRNNGHIVYSFKYTPVKEIHQDIDILEEEHFIVQEDAQERFLELQMLLFSFIYLPNLFVWFNK